MRLVGIATAIGLAYMVLLVYQSSLQSSVQYLPDLMLLFPRYICYGEAGTMNVDVCWHVPVWRPGLD